MNSPQQQSQVGAETMKTPNSSDVIQGDEQCRDGHYRAKLDLRTKAETSTGADPAAELDPNSSTSLQAQNPTDLGNLRIGRASEEAAGIPAIWNTMLYGIGEMGPIRSTEAFLKINHVTGFDCQSCAWPSPDKKRKTFEFCENGAKALSDESTKKRVGAEFFAKHSIAELAAKSDYWLNQQGRLTSPMVRHANATHYQPITWSEAFAMIAQELNTLDSPDQASFYTSGKTTNEPAFLLQLFARQFGTNNLPDCSNMCHESSGVAMVETLGVGKGAATLEDMESSELIFIFGNNPGTNHPRMLTSLQKAKDQGAKIIAVNPLPEVSLMRVTNPNPQDYPNPLELPFALLGKGQALADLYLPVRVNGDVAAIKGILKDLFERERAGQISQIDHGFIQTFTEGFEAVQADVQATSWEEIEENSGLSRNQLHVAADMYAASKKTIIAWCLGVTQQRNGVDNVSMIVNLLLAGGHIGRPGAGTVCVRGHSNVQGDRTMGVWERPPKAFLDALGKEFNFEPPRKWGYDTVETLHAMFDGDLKVFFAISGNFLSNVPDTVYSAHGMQRCKLTAHVSTKLNRSHLITGERALILPCLGRSEEDLQATGKQFLTVEDSMGIIDPTQGFFPPASPELMSDVAILANLAHATLGSRTTTNWLAFAADYNLIRDAISRVIPGFENFNARLAKEKFFYLPNAAKQRNFKTSSGKAKFTVCPIPKHELKPDEFLLTTIRSHDQFNSTIYGLNDRYRGVFDGRRVLFLNPLDMQARNLQPGQIVDIYSHFEGEVRKAPRFAIVPYAIARHSAAAYYPETNVLIPICSVAAKSNQPASKCIRITLTPRDPGEALHFSRADLARNLDRAVPRVP
ncbi:MAG: FdhF/YdeP family oxidoreductase [Candidatus Acidiferrum sp.]|jgi:molybdopterin-dependent oxidoreductase alpha subunit